MSDTRVGYLEEELRIYQEREIHLNKTIESWHEKYTRAERRIEIAEAGFEAAKKKAAAAEEEAKAARGALMNLVHQIRTAGGFGPGAAIQDQVHTVVEALLFYADPATYFAIGFFPDPPCGEFMEDIEETEIGQKPGKRARAAIQEVLRDRSVEEPSAS